MKSYDPAFQDRIKAATAAQQKALDKLKARPPVDEAVMAERRAAAERREAAEAVKRAARHEAREQAAAEKAARKAEAAVPVSAPRILTESERKGARDARYAARQERKRK